MSSEASSRVSILQENESIVLPESLGRSAGFVGLEAWLSFIHNVYGFPVYRIASKENNDIDGWLALVRVQHLIFGNYLTTSPFGSYGGFAYSSMVARDALLEKARALPLAYAVNGMGMLIAQAAQSFRRFFHAEPPRELDDMLGRLVAS